MCIDVIDDLLDVPNQPYFIDLMLAIGDGKHSQ